MDKVDTVGYFTIYWSRDDMAFVVYMTDTDAHMLTTQSSTAAYDFCRARMRLMRGTFGEV